MWRREWRVRWPGGWQALVWRLGHVRRRAAEALQEAKDAALGAPAAKPEAKPAAKPVAKAAPAPEAKAGDPPAFDEAALDDVYGA